MELNSNEAARLDRQLKDTRERRPSSNLLTEQLSKTNSKKSLAQTRLAGLMLNAQELVMLSPRDGVVGIAPRPDDVGKFYEEQLDPNSPFCTINEPGRLRVVLPLVTPEFNQLKETVERLSPAAPTATAATGAVQGQRQLRTDAAWTTC